MEDLAFNCVADYLTDDLEHDPPPARLQLYCQQMCDLKCDLEYRCVYCLIFCAHLARHRNVRACKNILLALKTAYEDACEQNHTPSTLLETILDIAPNILEVNDADERNKCIIMFTEMYAFCHTAPQLKRELREKSILETRLLELSSMSAVTFNNLFKMYLIQFIIAPGERNILLYTDIQTVTHCDYVIGKLYSVSKLHEVEAYCNLPKEELLKTDNVRATRHIVYILSLHQVAVSCGYTTFQEDFVYMEAPDEAPEVPVFVRDVGTFAVLWKETLIHADNIVSVWYDEIIQMHDILPPKFQKLLQMFS